MKNYISIIICNFQKSFQRKSTYDWTQYTHLVFKVRGDGRSYLINLGTEGYFDVNWYNMYSYGLFTRGGPYWQISKVSAYFFEVIIN